MAPHQDMRGFMKQITLITGASRGLGFAVASALAGPQNHLIAIARTIGGLEELDDVIKSKGGTATLVPMDLTQEEGLQDLGKSIFERWGHLDTFIHCAAHATPLAPIGHVDPKDLDRGWAINARATQRLITMLDPLLKSSKSGQAIYCHDPCAVPKFFGSYRTSKLAALSYVESWQAESPQTGPNIKVFVPEPMPTALRARFYPGEDREALSSPASQAQKLIELLD